MDITNHEKDILENILKYVSLYRYIKEDPTLHLNRLESALPQHAL